MAGDAVPSGTTSQPTAAAVAAPILPPLRHPVLPSARGKEPEALESTTVEQDVAELSMSTLSFQDYVRERMLRRRQAEKQDQAQKQADTAAAAAHAAALAARPEAPASTALRERAGAGVAAGAGRTEAAARGVAPDLHSSLPQVLREPVPVARPTAGRAAGARRHAVPRRTTRTQPRHARGRQPRQQRDDERTARHARPDRRPLRRAGLHGKAAAPAAPGATDAATAGAGLLARADPQTDRQPAGRGRRHGLGRQRAGAQPGCRDSRSCRWKTAAACSR